MAKDYPILLKGNLQALATATTLKVGKGKNAIDVIGIRKVGQGVERWYYLDHIPSGHLISGRFIYQAIARHAGQVLVDTLGDTLRNDAESVRAAIEGPIADFIEYIRLPRIQEALNSSKRSKEALPTLEDFLNGPYYESLLIERNGGAVPGASPPKHDAELLECDQSLGWVSSPNGRLDGDDLRALVEGRRTPSEIILSKP